MNAAKMHEGEVETDAELVRELLAAQFPQWAGLPVERVASSGTDNALYRLGETMLVRMPRIDWAIRSVEKEQAWLPRLAPHLPVAVPVPLALGRPGSGYPWPWSVYTWLDGANPVAGALADADGLAHDIARFVTALRALDITDGPLAGEHNGFRGQPLGERDGVTRRAIRAARTLIDADAVLAAWDDELRTPEWDGPPVWIHADLAAGNLLCGADGRLRAVIDFGCLGVGDPALDLIVAWNTLPSGSRDVLRAALEVDDASWARGRGWALSIALLQLPYYVETNPPLAANSRYVIEEVLADHHARPSRRD